MVKVDIVETNLEFGDLQERSVTDMIVIHHTGENDIDASAAQIHEWHLNNNWAGCGYHFDVRKDGTIERGRPEWAVGSHAYGENSHTIGIHLSGDFQQANPTEAQVEKCAMLVAYLCQKYDIPIDRQHIVGHGELMSTDCPGVNLQALLDDGTITGKAAWYANGGNAENYADPEIVIPPDMPECETDKRYKDIDDVPEWGQATIQKLLNKGLLSGDGDGLDLSRDMLRVFVVLDRAGALG